jgi:hypothetical protein
MLLHNSWGSFEMSTNKIKWAKSVAVASVLSVTVLLSGCALWGNAMGNIQQHLKGKEATIRTFATDGKMIDRIKGKSMSIGADGKFDLTDSNGATVQKSDVIVYTVGKAAATHVGSSLILAEDGLVDVFAEYQKTVDIENMDKSIPIVNRMISDLKNITTGKKKVILIKSQDGIPIATYMGEKVSYFATDINKSTSFLIDGKLLFIYRSDYSSYDIELLQQ